ncbi:MAG: polysaccharide deacetylase family protein, partial [Patescibacteria group bacterium]|nr:polysaccharide deacetylase family protein [Patescibacteria group bacterium]
TFGIITQYPSQQQGDNFYAPWPRIAQAKQDGMEIVCHTQNHFNGKDPKYSAVYIYENLSGCQQDISSHLGSAEPFLIYPYGAYTPTYIQQAQKAGFAMALTIHYGQYVDVADLMQTPRVRVNGDESLARFAKVMSEDYQGASSTPKTAAN